MRDAKKVGTIKPEKKKKKKGYFQLLTRRKWHGGGGKGCVRQVNIMQGTKASASIQETLECLGHLTSEFSQIK